VDRGKRDVPSTKKTQSENTSKSSLYLAKRKKEKKKKRSGGKEIDRKRESMIGRDYLCLLREEILSGLTRGKKKGGSTMCLEKKGRERPWGKNKKICFLHQSEEKEGGRTEKKPKKACRPESGGKRGKRLPPFHGEKGK